MQFSEDRVHFSFYLARFLPRFVLAGVCVCAKEAGRLSVKNVATSVSFDAEMGHLFVIS